LRKEFSKRTGGLCDCGQPSINKIKVAVDDLSFHVEAGEVFGLLGHNGAGKTTALNAITADIGLTNGQVSFMGITYLSWGIRMIKEQFFQHSLGPLEQLKVKRNTLA
jgi:ABC-type multidrug transport system ATPase subunit